MVAMAERHLTQAKATLREEEATQDSSPQWDNSEAVSPAFGRLNCEQRREMLHMRTTRHVCDAEWRVPE